MIEYNRKVKEDEIMTFTAYIERQKRIIRDRHEGETFLINKGEVIALTETDRIFYDLNSLKGLNTNERLSVRRCKAHA